MRKVQSKQFLKIFFIVLTPVLIGVLLYVLIIISTTGPLPLYKVRVINITEIQAVMTLYYNKNSAYFQSPSIPSSIGQHEIPKDPEGFPYNWIDNTGDSQKFCVWAELKKRKTYFVASHCGAQEVEYQPNSLDECCELTKP